MRGRHFLWHEQRRFVLQMLDKWELVNQLRMKNEELWYLSYMGAGIWSGASRLAGILYLLAKLELVELSVSRNIVPPPFSSSRPGARIEMNREGNRNHAAMSGEIYVPCRYAKDGKQKERRPFANRAVPTFRGISPLHVDFSTPQFIVILPIENHWHFSTGRNDVRGIRNSM